MFENIDFKELIYDKFRSKLALVLIFVALFTMQYWLFGFLFLFWAIMDIKNKVTHLLEPIPQHSNPILYWIVILMWILFSFFSFSDISY